MTSIVLAIGLVVGALCGVVLNGVVGDLALAIIAGFIATITGSIVTNVAIGQIRRTRSVADTACRNCICGRCISWR